MELLRRVFVPIHPEGIIFAALFALIAGVLWAVVPPLGILGFILTAWCIYFFRNPERVTPTRAGLVISPADGFVQKIMECIPPQELALGKEPRVRISIFMNVFDVHINRVPIDGELTHIHYHEGKFLNASLDKASEHNERQSFVVTTPQKQTVGFVQIAGLVARRIRCDVQVGQKVKAGERFGLIRFGSRVDVYLPKNVMPLVIEGQYAMAGETVLADFQSSEIQRSGEIR